MEKYDLHLIGSTHGPDQQTAIPDPYAPENLRLDQSFAEIAGVKKLLTTIPVRKPGRQTFFRTHPDAEYRAQFPIVDFKDDQEEYIVSRTMVPELADELVVKTLVTAITKQGTLFLLPLRMPGPDGRDMGWWRSLREHADHAKTSWIRVVANRDLGAYDCLQATGQLPEPEWPEMPFWDLIKIAFRDHLIDTPDHPAVKRLRGLV